MSFDYNAALKHLKFGKTIRSTTWPIDSFIFYSEDGTYRDENGEIFSFDAQWDEDDFVFFEKEENECQNQNPETSEMTDGFGAAEHGEPSSKLSDEKNKLESEEKNIITTTSSESEQNVENIMSETKSDSTSSGKNIIKETEINETATESKELAEIPTKTKSNENIIDETESHNSRESSQIAENETPLSASQTLSERLKEERSSSMKLLNDSANHLMRLAKGVTPETIDDAHPTNIKLAVACFSEIRNTMKVKLEHLKFAKDLGETK